MSRDGERCLFLRIKAILCRFQNLDNETIQGCVSQKHLKGTVHPKMKILSSFTHPQVVPNLYEFVCSAEHTGRYFEESL